MENQSMRKRQTVLGDQLLNSNGGLQPPNARVGKHMRSFSRMASKTLQQPPLQELSLAHENNTQDSFLNDLSSPDFNPDEFIAKNLATADISELMEFTEKLKQQAQKHGDFGASGVEKTHFALNSLASNVSKVAPLVAELHKEINELSLVTSAMRQDAYAKRSADARRASSGSQDLETPEAEDLARDVGKRQSVLALNALWAADLNDFYLKIENSQKFIPPIEGRHIVLESEGWVELNLVNQQPVKSILVILLNDFLVLARNTNGRFQMDHFYNLKNHLEVKVQEKTLIVGQNSDARGLLAPSRTKLRQLHSELLKICSLQQKSSQITYTQTRSRPGSQQSLPGFNSETGPTQRHSQSQNSKRLSIHQPLRISTEDNKEICQILADLDLEIAHRDWNAAVAIIKEHEGSTLLLDCIPPRKKKIFDALADELKQPQPKSKVQTTELLHLLIGLGYRDESRRLFFETTAKDIELQALQVQFRGDVVNYISQLAGIYFQTVIYAVNVYRDTYNRKGDSSAIVNWAKSQIDLYAQAFNRQLYKISPELKGYQRCREVSRLESQQLKSLKMEMEFMLRYVWEG